MRKQEKRGNLEAYLETLAGVIRIHGGLLAAAARSADSAIVSHRLQQGFLA
jgi:hypothetical protein